MKRIPRNEGAKKACEALPTSLWVLLKYFSFKEITVRMLCAEAHVGRHTFRLYFKDKYDLLGHCLAEVWNGVAAGTNEDETLERRISELLCANEKIIANVLRDANTRTLACIHEFMHSIIGRLLKAGDGTSPNHMILYHFCAGGLVKHLEQIASNRFPSGMDEINAYLFRMLKAIAAWDAQQEAGEAGC